MARFIILIILLFFFFGFAQTNKEIFALEGFIQDRDTGIIVLFYIDNNKKPVRDTARLEKGVFKFIGKVAEPTFSSLKGTNNVGNFINFYLEPGTQKVFLQENRFDKIKMSGSFTQAQKDTLKDVLETIEIKFSKWLMEKEYLQSELKRNNDSTNKDSIENKLSINAEKIKILNRERLDAELKFIYDHPDSFVSATSLYGFLVSNRLKTERVLEIFITLTEKIKNSFSGNLIANEIGKRKINTVAPDFTVKDLNNTTLSLNDFKGKYVLINFWASWCAPCIKKFPELKQLLANYNSEGFEIINISIDEKRDDWLRTINKLELKVNFYNVRANKDIQSKYSNTKMPIPSEILVDPEGIILWNSMNVNLEPISTILQKCFAKK